MIYQLVIYYVPLTIIVKQYGFNGLWEGGLYHLQSFYVQAVNDLMLYIALCI